LGFGLVKRQQQCFGSISHDGSTDLRSPTVSNHLN
jgi:hypothetical protein